MSEAERRFRRIVTWSCGTAGLLTSTQRQKLAAIIRDGLPIEIARGIVGDRVLNEILNEGTK